MEARLIVSIAIAVYLAPTILAVLRSKANWLAIFLLNIFAGWTFIGWVIALVWAASKDAAVLKHPEGTVEQTRID